MRRGSSPKRASVFMPGSRALSVRSQVFCCEFVGVHVQGRCRPFTNAPLLHNEGDNEEKMRQRCR